MGVEIHFKEKLDTYLNMKLNLDELDILVSSVFDNQKLNSQ